MRDKDCHSLGCLVASFLPCIVQFDWLISDQLRYSLNIYQFDCSVLCFLIKNSSNKKTKSTSCFIFLFEISEKKMKLMKKFWKRLWKEKWFLGIRDILKQNRDEIWEWKYAQEVGYPWDYGIAWNFRSGLRDWRTLLETYNPGKTGRVGRYIESTTPSRWSLRETKHIFHSTFFLQRSYLLL